MLAYSFVKVDHICNMAETRLTLSIQEPGYRISHTSRGPTDIDSFEVKLYSPPYTRDYIPKSPDLRIELTEAIQGACGRSACNSTCRFDVDTRDPHQLVEGVFATCLADDCPMTEASSYGS